jgi:hypothetical protein
VSVLDRAAADVAAGRLWKARDRLAGALRDAPADVRVLAALADVHRRMGDLPAAGLHRLLTEAGPPPDEDEALRERFGSPQALFTALPARAPVEAYPAAVQERLEALARDLDEPWRWRTKLDRLGLEGTETFAASEPARRSAIAGVLALVILFLLGVISAVRYAAEFLDRLF